MVDSGSGAPMSDLIEGRIVDQLGADLLAARERLEVVLGNISEGVTITGPDGRFLFANAAAARLIGIESPEVLVALPPGETVSRFRIYDADGAPLPLADLPGRRAFAGDEPGEKLVRFRPVGGGEER